MWSQVKAAGTTLVDQIVLFEVAERLNGSDLEEVFVENSLEVDVFFFFSSANR